MDRAFLEQVRAIFDAARKLPPSDWPSFLERECIGVPHAGQLRAEVESLLRSLDDAGEFLAAPTVPEVAPDETRDSSESLKPSAPFQTDDAAYVDDTGSGTTLQPALHEGPGTRIGPYKLLQQIGEGGFGVVFMAEQEKPVRRRVALKIIKLGMDTRQVVARFEAERQALAVMDHPNIAKVHDGGATETGRPYFVMELVKGSPVTVYCDEHKLPIRQRLDLFVQVCQAVQHAHTKGVIHRDIKPSNVLVSEVDGRPLVKVIDFGIAKATDHRLTEKTVFTQFEQMIGTPQYMSPEQAAGNLDIDTRTDVYSLGVLLYELLTGTTPFEGKKLRSAAYDEIRRIIREEDPPKPSTRLSSSTNSLPSVAAVRQIEPGKLTKLVRGDLDWIVMKALEKDRGRRYETANGFAADVLRSIAHEPVAAGPPSRSYRLRKLVRRNRVAVITVGCGVVLLVAGITGTSLGMVRARRAQHKAEVESSKAKAVSDVLTRMFNSPNPYVEGRDTKAVDILKQGLQEIDRSLVNQPESAAALRALIGNSFDGLGMYVEAESLLRSAMESRRALLGPNHVDTLDTSVRWASMFVRLGQPAKGVEALQETVARCRRALGPDHTLTVHARIYLSSALKESSRFSEAETEAQAVYDLCRQKFGDENPDTLQALDQVGSVLWGAGKNEQAIEVYRRLLDGQRRTWGPHSPWILGTINNLGTALQSLNRHDEAIALLRESSELCQEVLGADDPNSMKVASNLAVSLLHSAKAQEAEQTLERLLPLQERKLGMDHRQTLNTSSGIAECQRAQGRFVEAEDTHRRTLERQRRSLGDEHIDTLVSMNNLALTLQAQGKYEEAEGLLQRASQTGVRVLGEDNMYALSWIFNLAQLLSVQNRYDAAEPVFRRAFDLAERGLPQGHYYRVGIRSGLGMCLLRLNKMDEAEPLLTSAFEEMTLPSGAVHSSARNTASALAYLYQQLGDREKTAEWRRKTEQLSNASGAASKPATTTAISSVASSASAPNDILTSAPSAP